MARRLIPLVSCALVPACGADTSESAVPRVDFARTPPGPRAARDVRQLVAVTFDDNFGLANERASGGVAAIVDYYRGKDNPAGAGRSEDFDGAPLRTTFFHTSLYALDESEQAFDGAPGEDQGGRNLAAWRAARDAGHEVAVHTVHHFNGGIVPLDPDDCCRARDFDVASWEREIDGCRDLVTAASHLGESAANVVGFRAPFLGFNDAG